MTIFWIEAVKAGGVAAIGGFVFYSLTKMVLHSPLAVNLTKNQRFKILITVPILGFLFSFFMAVAWVMTRPKDAFENIRAEVTSKEWNIVLNDSVRFSLDVSKLSDKQANALLPSAVSEELVKLGDFLEKANRLENAVYVFHAASVLNPLHPDALLERFRLERHLARDQTGRRSIALEMHAEASALLGVMPQRSGEFDLDLNELAERESERLVLAGALVGSAVTIADVGSEAYQQARSLSDQIQAIAINNQSNLMTNRVAINAMHENYIRTRQSGKIGESLIDAALWYRVGGGLRSLEEIRLEIARIVKVIQQETRISTHLENR